MKYLLFPLLFLVFATTVQAQGITGAEMYKDYEYPYLSVTVEVWREGPSRPFILFDWGDNSKLDTLFLYGSQPFGENSVVDGYYKYHQYDTSGLIRLGFQDDFLVPNIKNIDASEEKRFVLYDTVSFVEPELAVNTSPMLYSTPTNVSLQEDGSLYHPIYLGDENFFFDEYELSWHPYPAEGYTEPAAVNSFYVQGAFMIWDRPIEPGRYAVGINIRETRNGVFQSSTLRAMLIDVDESLLVNNNEADIQQLLALYPNPTSETATLEYGGLEGDLQVRISNMQGQLVYQQTLAGAAGLQRESILVNDWPAGVYTVALHSDSGRVVRKLVVE